ncbi:LysR substrate-binding domain-containing protein [Phenylobacterium sp.]|jgi:LysR family glycine cleavage system transcriptional activator|uniref:LysR substrate-binding domain-containing protein n=1 Tax=Phenylobacterium sp. TaxID=1871053 RepID=UPI0037848822
MSGEGASASTTDKGERLDFPPFATLRAFDAVGRCGGIRKAAQFLGIDHTVVSRHVRVLESWLNVELYDRRRFVLTEEGRNYHTKVAAALLDLTIATRETMRRKEAGVLKVTANPGFGVRWLVRKLSAFGSQHPAIEIEFRPRDEIPDLLRHEADVDIRWIRGFEPKADLKGVKAMVLTRTAGFCVASPEYASKVKINTVSDLLQANLIHEQDSTQWRSWLALHGVSVPDELGGPRRWQAHAALEAARSGEGVALTNVYLVGDDLATGRLVMLGPPGANGFALTGGGYQFLALEARWQQRAITLLRNWLANEMANNPPYELDEPVG